MIPFRKLHLPSRRLNLDLELRSHLGMVPPQWKAKASIKLRRDFWHFHILPRSWVGGSRRATGIPCAYMLAAIACPEPAMISTPISASKLSTSDCLSPVLHPSTSLALLLANTPNLSELVAISRETFQKQSRSRLNTTIDHHLPTWIMPTLLLTAGSENPVVCRG